MFKKIINWRRHERLEEESTSADECQPKVSPVAEDSESCCQKLKNKAIMGGVAVLIKALLGFAVALYMIHLRYYEAWTDVVFDSITVVVITPILFWGIHHQRRPHILLWIVWNYLIVAMIFVGVIVLLAKRTYLGTGPIVAIYANATWVLLASRPVYVLWKALKPLEPALENEPHL